MTIDALRRLAALLNDAAGYASDLARAATAALLLAEDERPAARIRRRSRTRRTTPEAVSA